MGLAMLSLEEVTEKIIEGKRLLLAGDERLLLQLPAGDWIAGTIPYFMTEEGGDASGTGSTSTNCLITSSK